MELDKQQKTHLQKRKAWLILISGVVLAVLWLWLLPQCLLPTWEIFTFLPEAFYFPIEEFLALNAHHNSLLVQLGGVVIIACTLVWSLKLNGKPQKSHEYIALAVVILLLGAMMLPCLCVSHEVARRLRCASELKEAYLQLSLFADENNGKLPGTFAREGDKHPINYYGTGRSLQESPFVLLEDAQRCHAGDVRHQLWSNGEIKTFYPWKKHDAHAPTGNEVEQ